MSLRAPHTARARRREEPRDCAFLGAGQRAFPRALPERRALARFLLVSALLAAPLCSGPAAPAGNSAAAQSAGGAPHPAAAARKAAPVSSSGAANKAAPAGDFFDRGDAEARADALLAGMSDEEVLGQLFMMAYPGETPPELLYEWIQKRGLGGVKLFGWNAEKTDQLPSIIASLQKTALGRGTRIPLLIATDQEGGWIRHVKGATSETPGNMAIGASDRPYDAYWSAYYIGRELDVLGINMNFAPAVDLATNPRSTIIGPRAFSANPAEAAALGVAYYRGLEAAGIIATAKHFPGHGSTNLDSHGTMPVIRIDEKTLMSRELVPFSTLSAEGVPAIMSGHLNFPYITGDNKPASLSKRFMTGILRGIIGFKGVAVTDDLLMAGTGTGDLGEACYEAIAAGNDLLMASHFIAFDDPAWNRLLSAYRRDSSFRARVREAARRVLILKLNYLRPKEPAGLVPDPAKAASGLPDRDGQKFWKEQAFRGATVLNQDRLPLKAAPGRILLAGPLKDFFDSGLAVYPEAKSFRYSYRPESAALGSELSAFRAAARGADLVIVCVTNEAGMDYVETARAMGKQVAVLSLLSPEPLARLAKSEPAVVVYGDSLDCMKAGFDVLSGREKAQGRLPMRPAP